MCPIMFKFLFLFHIGAGLCINHVNTDRIIVLLGVMKASLLFSFHSYLLVVE